MNSTQQFTKRKIHLWAALIVLLLVLCLASSAFCDAFPFTATSTAKVNLRKNPSTSSKVLDTIWQGDTVEVTGEEGNYFKVEYGGKTGYVVKQYLTLPDTIGSAVTDELMSETAPQYPYNSVTVDSVNLRQKANTSSTKICTIPKNAPISVESVSGSYARVTYNGNTGYVKKEFIHIKKIVKPTATPSPVPTLTPEENSSGYRILQQGVTGDDVAALQQSLTELGFFKGICDGNFGTATYNAAVNFQSANSYPATGIVDANLQAFLYSGTVKNNSGAKVEISILSPVKDVAISLNKKGDIVGKVQTRLQELGYYTGTISCVFDKLTRSALQDFEKKNGMASTSNCTLSVREKLFGGNVITAFGTLDAVEVTLQPLVEMAVPTLAPAVMPKNSVKRGSKGSDATLVQQRLIELGYLEGNADGLFGEKSEKALKAFQKANFLNEDGIASSDTYNILFSAKAVNANGGSEATVAATSVPQATEAILTPDNVVIIKAGSAGDNVTALQNRLKLLGYYNKAVDGKCGGETVAAIKSFQKKNNLKADGTAGFDTQNLLFSNAALTNTGALAGNALSSFTTLKKGMTGTEVRNLQQRLIDLNYLTGAADGKFGTATAEAVVKFQRANNLVRDGIAGSSTLNLIYSKTAVSQSPTATSEPMSAAATVLKKGDSSDAVKEMQQRLISLGYLSGKADGKFGINTYRALIAFQSKNNLTKDGIAGKNTLNALNSSAAQSMNNAAAPTLPPAVTVGQSITPTVVTPQNVTASMVKYENWYDSIRSKARKYPYATVYDYSTGISWQVHMFSLGAHADSEPLTASDTAKMVKAFGGKNTWTAKPVWVIFGDGSVYMASTHDMPHEVQHITTNDFPGHLCIHFPRTQSQVTAIGPYATSHQAAIDKGWAETQQMQ